MAYELDKPEDRLAFIDRFGIPAYNQAMKDKLEKDVVANENGYPIRSISTRFGRLYSVDNTGNAYKSLDDAKRYANSRDPA